MHTAAQVKRTKEVLSANSEAPISVEELHDGVDFRSRITRCCQPASPLNFEHDSFAVLPVAASEAAVYKTHLQLFEQLPCCQCPKP